MLHSISPTRGTTGLYKPIIAISQFPIRAEPGVTPGVAWKIKPPRTALSCNLNHCLKVVNISVYLVFVKNYIIADFSVAVVYLDWNKTCFVMRCYSQSFTSHAVFCAFCGLHSVSQECRDICAYWPQCNKTLLLLFFLLFCLCIMARYVWIVFVLLIRSSMHAS